MGCVWNFMRLLDGELTNEHNEDMNSLLTINAMDGTIIDRDFGH